MFTFPICLNSLGTWLSSQLVAKDQKGVNVSSTPLLGHTHLYALEVICSLLCTDFSSKLLVRSHKSFLGFTTFSTLFWERKSMGFLSLEPPSICYDPPSVQSISCPTSAKSINISSKGFLQPKHYSHFRPDNSWL